MQSTGAPAMNFLKCPARSKWVIGVSCELLSPKLFPSPQKEEVTFGQAN